MADTASEKPHRVGFFDSVAQADRAVRDLLAAGFSKDELAVICPEKCQEQFAQGVPRAEMPGSHAGKEIAFGERSSYGWILPRKHKDNDDHKRAEQKDSHEE